MKSLEQDGLCCVRGLEQVRPWLEEGSVLSEPAEHFTLGLRRVPSADSLSLGHNGIKLIISQCDRV